MRSFHILEVLLLCIVLMLFDGTSIRELVCKTMAEDVCCMGHVCSLSGVREAH